MSVINRRQVLAAGGPWALLTAVAGIAPARGAPPSALRFGEPRPFSFELLRERARALAARPYVAPAPAPRIVDSVDFDAVQAIKFRADRALWPSGPGAYPVRLFHVDKFNPLGVRINELSNGQARELLYSPDCFDYKNEALASTLPPDLGFSGFRVMDGRGKETDWLAFQGASYFRTSGEENQYGASARGIAINTAMPQPEEFPRFVEFWLEEPKADAPSITVYALLDGPSIAGAYRFDAVNGRAPLMTVSANLYARTDIDRLGAAPLTSMFWYGENDRRHATDWRPEVHDSDGLAMWTGVGEHIWRPLNNGPFVRTNTFSDASPKGFGLMQRDRDFREYQDDGAFYNKRPGIWVEPIGDWGEGAVQLVEIPTKDETNDNIVAYWVPKNPVRAGDELAFNYKLYWQNDEPNPPVNIGRVVSTHTGAGGVPGVPRPDDLNKRKFVIDFAGGPLANLEQRFDVTPVVSHSRGRVDNAYVIKVVGTERWRALFDLTTEGDGPVDLRCYLRLGEETLSETWMYQWLPKA
ncbi:MAG: glucan biosynthesis protein [Hyphomicrobium sp.]|uniref:glucan biosynthesis protein n=1 Tax=Hyphomicrobium sp. TaxID=82 RepID=UPI001323817E|nr:glucan biosynthesis protein [Hyphomicrobium sp.]KAB2941543.1 MAG: glucan biosynthesis protein [Hyphomicrobium sp.]MBZ0210265.1 glucan biosynthesis protein [Hyphomicrobium sp.]